MKKICAIDFSLISPALTNYNSTTQSYNFYSFTACPSLKSYVTSKKYDTHRSISPYVSVVPYIRNIDHTSYQTTEETKITDAINLTSLILEKINQFSPDFICIEGFSYCSKGASAIDLIMYQSILRAKIKEQGYKLIVVSPAQGKKALSDRGNATKMEMIQAFIENIHHVQGIEENTLWQYMNKNKDIIDFEKKPWNDLVDSFGICLAGMKIIEKN